MIIFTPYAVLLAAMSVIMTVLTVQVFRFWHSTRGGDSVSETAGGMYRRCAPELLYVMVLVGFTVFCMMLEFIFTSPDAKIFWCTIRFVAFACLPPSVLRLYLRFIGSRYFMSRRAFIGLHVIPAATFIMVLTNPLHHMFWVNREVVSMPFVSYVYNHSGPFFWLHSVYSYILLMGSYIALLAGILKKPRIYRRQGYIMLAGALASLLINLIYIIELFIGLGDLTIPAMFVASGCLYWALFVYKPVNMIRMARALVVNELGTPVVIFDNKNIMIDANQCALYTLDMGLESVFRMPLSAFMEKLGFDESENLDKREIKVVNGDEREFSVIDKKLTDKKGRQIGRYIVLSDITHIKNVVKELEYSNTHDHLTGMLNRHVFPFELKKIDRIEDLPIAVISLNIYGMKFLNTVFGYEFGDRMITLAAETITRLTENRGICARISGDEFVVALRNTREQEAAEFIRRIEAAANEPAEAHITLSCGIAIKTTRSENIDLVFKNAVSRMFRDKLLEAKEKSSALFVFLQDVLQNNQYETEGHVERIRQLAGRIAEHMHFTPAQCENIRLLSITHNIGILSTAVDIVKRTGALSNEEWEEVRLHAKRGYNIALLFPELTMIAEDILHHHERFDGLGYPEGLKGDDIPIGSQIMLLVNYYDSLVYPRPPQPPMSEAQALENIKKQAGGMFSPALVQNFTEVIGSGSADSNISAVRQGDDAAIREILKLLDMD